MQQESLTQQWLRQNVQPYVAAGRVYADTDGALARFPTIRPKTDVYTYDDGRTQLLLCLHGLLPIAFRGASYNIPIALWVPRDYPREPPIAYVVPTSDMLVKASRHVDPSGRCATDYHQQWTRKPEGCNIVGLLEAMQDHFSRDPPLYAKPPAQAQAQGPASHQPSPSISAQTATYAAKPPPPLPGQQPSHLERAASTSAAPALPPKPPSAAHTPVPGTPAPATPVPAVAAVAHGPPPPPARPPQHLFQQHQQPYSPAPTPSSASSPAPAPPSRPPVPSGASAYSTPPPGHRWSQSPVGPTPAPGPTSAPQYRYPQYPQHHHPPAPAGSPPPPLPPGHTHPISPPPLLAPSSSGTPSPAVPGQSLNHAYPAQAPQQQQRYPSHRAQFAAPLPDLGPVPDHAPRPHPPPPPNLLDDDGPSSSLASATNPASSSFSSSSSSVPERPPNPHLLALHAALHAKLTASLASLRAALDADAARLRAQQAALLAAGPAIADERARLEAVKDVCKGVAGRLGEVVRRAEEGVEGVRRRGEPGVDECVCAVSIVHNQLINLVAEDNAIEDTVYHLHRALNAGRIDLERFLRTTRALAEEQFMKRALIEKIQTGLAASS